MSEPETIPEYLAALNASLEIGLRSRWRIFSEVVDHLSQAVREQLDGGASPEEAQRRVIAAFGSPEEVAARFEAGLIGALDRRLALGARLLSRWSQRPAGVAVLAAALGMGLAAAFAAVAASFGRDPLLAAASFLSAGTAWALYGSTSRSFRDAMRSWQTAPTLFALPGVYSCLILLAGEEDFPWNWLGYFTLVYALLFLFEWAIERADLRRAGSSEGDRRWAWRENHPWRAALSVVVSLPLGLVVLVVVHPGPIDLRVALVGLIAAMTTMAAAAVRLEQARQEKDAYQHGYENPSWNWLTWNWPT